jgi:hypothetical protein
MRDRFERDGYALFKSAFDQRAVAELRSAVESVVLRTQADGSFSSEGFADLCIPQGDLASMPELEQADYLVFNETVLEAVRQLIGPRVVYFRDSNLQMGQGARGRHKDNVHRTDPCGSDWQSHYDVVRFGLYLQDHAQHSGGLQVSAGSHRREKFDKGAPINLPIEAGDLLVWKLTTTHSGNAVRLRGIPQVCLHPGLENRAPLWMRRPEEHKRIAIFGTFAAAGSHHMQTYLTVLKSRPDFMRHLSSSPVRPGVSELASRRGVELLQPALETSR